MTNIVNFNAERERAELIETPSLLAMQDVLADCHQHNKLGLIQTGVGCGKTTCLKSYAQAHPYGAVLVTLSPAAKSPTAAMSATLEALKDFENRGDYGALGLTPPRRDPIMHRLYKSFREILQMAAEIKRWRGPALIIVDEAQHAPPETHDTFRALFDEGLCGLVIAGNDRLFNSRKGRMEAADFSPLLSRAHHVLQIPYPTNGDVDAVLDAFRITGQRSRDLLHSRAELGGLREAVAIIHKARALSGTAPVGHTHLKAAASTTGLSAFRSTTKRR